MTDSVALSVEQIIGGSSIICVTRCNKSIRLHSPTHLTSSSASHEAVRPADGGHGRISGPDEPEPPELDASLTILHEDSPGARSKPGRVSAARLAKVAAETRRSRSWSGSETWIHPDRKVRVGSCSWLRRARLASRALPG